MTPAAARPFPRGIRDARGFTLVEMLVTLAILLIVMAGITQVYVSGVNAEAQEQRQFDAQSQGRTALDKLRIDVHCAGSAAGGAVFSGTKASNDLFPELALSESGIGFCPAAGTTIRWCAVSSGGRISLHRSLNSGCSSASEKWADYLTSTGVFGQSDVYDNGLARVHVDIEIDSRPSVPGDSYRLIDDLTLRNTIRS